MRRALWKGTVIAKSKSCQKVEGNWYFPPDALTRQYVRDSSTRTRCRWKGIAHYYHIVVKGVVNRDGAWYYPQTEPQADHIKGWVAFWQGVEIQGDRIKY